MVARVTGFGVRWADLMSWNRKFHPVTQSKTANPTSKREGKGRDFHWQRPGVKGGTSSIKMVVMGQGICQGLGLNHLTRHIALWPSTGHPNSLSDRLLKIIACPCSRYIWCDALALKHHPLLLLLETGYRTIGLTQ